MEKEEFIKKYDDALKNQTPIINPYEKHVVDEDTGEPRWQKNLI